MLLLKRGDGAKSHVTFRRWSSSKPSIFSRGRWLLVLGFQGVSFRSKRKEESRIMVYFLLPCVKLYKLKESKGVVDTADDYWIQRIIRMILFCQVDIVQTTLAMQKSTTGFAKKRR